MMFYNNIEKRFDEFEYADLLNDEKKEDDKNNSE